MFSGGIERDLWYGMGELANGLIEIEMEMWCVCRCANCIKPLLFRIWKFNIPMIFWRNGFSNSVDSFVTVNWFKKSWCNSPKDGSCYASFIALEGWHRFCFCFVVVFVVVIVAWRQALSVSKNTFKCLDKSNSAIFCIKWRDVLVNTLKYHIRNVSHKMTLHIFVLRKANVQIIQKSFHWFHLQHNWPVATLSEDWTLMG